MFFWGFISGLVCTGVVFFVLPRRRPCIRFPAAPAGEREDWSQTRNFLYYDGTEMPDPTPKTHRKGDTA